LSSKVLTLVLVLLVAGCGFRLRGTADVPFQTLYLPGATSGIALACDNDGPVEEAMEDIGDEAEDAAEDVEDAID